jgi:alpha-glucosidase
MPADNAWWRHGVFYQLYPRSFMDSWVPCPDRPAGGYRPGAACTCGARHAAVGDGIGDLEGIIDRLDYLNDGTERSLGIDAIWLSPTFPSPMKDFGYDVSDYCDVHRDFGDLAMMDRLIAACHQRGIRLLLDFVPNHTSDQHPWFIESRGSRDNPKRDWYVWRDPRPDGGPPNNWLATFGGPAWTWDERTRQYYLHLFLPEQPDLNWRNPAVVEAMHDVLRFWMRRGVDGFRIDVMGSVLKDPELRDNPPNPDPRAAQFWGEAWSQLHIYDRNWPDVFDAVRGIRRVLDEFPGRMAVGEVFGDPQTLAAYYGGDACDGLHLAFNFALIRARRETGYTPWDAAVVRAIVDRFEAALPAGAWPNYVLSNHDVSRFISRHNADGRGGARARVAAMLLLTLRGTPFIYYGDEIGMADVPIPEEQAKDPARFHAVGRDPARTPMQWDAGPGRGFTTGEPWLPFGDPAINVAAQTDDPDSLLSLHRRLIHLRKRSPALQRGGYRPLARVPAPVFAYTREAEDERLLIALNFSSTPQTVALPDEVTGRDLVLATHPARGPQSGLTRDGRRIELGGDEGVIVALR